MSDREYTGNVDDVVADYYAAETMSPDRLARLTAMTDATDRGTRQAGASRRRALVVGGFAIAAAMMLVTTASLTERTTPGSSDKSATAIAKEIALNHNKQLAVEFPAQKYRSLTRVMNKLDFEPSQPVSRRCNGSTLIGGRYCSIGSAIACQLKLRGEDGNIQTLYQTRWAKAYADLTDRTVVVDGVRVRFWRQRDILFGLASSVQAKRAHR